MDSGYVKELIQLGNQVLQPPSKFGNFTNYMDILRPYEIGIGAYSKVNIKYINLLTYDSITKIALF
jgi:hypothetical protein